MFFHQFVIIAMTALTLLCPYLPCGECCEACDAGVFETTSAESTNANTCCLTHDPQCKDQIPAQTDCPVGGKVLNCFCGGAIVSSSVVCPDVAIARDYAFTIGIAEMRSLSCLRLTMHPLDAGCHFPTLMSGRDIRNLAASYLL